MTHRISTGSVSNKSTVRWLEHVEVVRWTCISEWVGVCCVCVSGWFHAAGCGAAARTWSSRGRTTRERLEVTSTSACSTHCRQERRRQGRHSATSARQHYRPTGLQGALSLQVLPCRESSGSVMLFSIILCHEESWKTI